MKTKNKATVLIGDVLERIADIEDGSVNCVVTSPPYFGHRDYNINGQIGMEETPKEFIRKLIKVFREVKRVLRDDGVLWVNIGDAYCNTNGFERTTKDFARKGSVGAKANGRSMKSLHEAGFKTKDLLGIPWMLAFALRKDGWYLRSDITWEKPNAQPEPVKDRVSRSHEYIFMLTKSPKYYYNHEAIREPSERSGTRNKRSVWTVTVKPYKGHTATFPPDLIEPCILATCPEQGTVLDIFHGSGTVCFVSLKHRRNYIGTELNPSYIDLSKTRIADDKYISGSYKLSSWKPSKKHKKAILAFAKHRKTLKRKK